MIIILNNIYKNHKAPIFVTVGTGGAHDMVLSSLKDFAAEGFDGTFGILNNELKPDQKTLTSTFIENGKKMKVLDELKIIKNKTWIMTNFSYNFFSCNIIYFLHVYLI